LDPKVQEFRSNAELCRRLASGGSAEQQEALAKMAETWDRLAREREEKLGQPGKDG
jgi:hypothetical protein